MVGKRIVDRISHRHQQHMAERGHVHRDCRATWIVTHLERFVGSEFRLQRSIHGRGYRVDRLAQPAARAQAARPIAHLRREVNEPEPVEIGQMKLHHGPREAFDGIGRVFCLLDSCTGAGGLGLQGRQCDAGDQILLGRKPVDHRLLRGAEPRGHGVEGQLCRAALARQISRYLDDSPPRVAFSGHVDSNLHPYRR